MMLKRFAIVAGILLLAVAGLGPTAGVTASSAAGSAAGATPSQTLLTIACPSVTDCYAGGNNGTLQATHDGGAAWQSQSWEGGYRKNVTKIDNIACPSASDCFAQVQAGCEELGAHVPFLHTTDGGTHWLTTTIDGCGSSLACPEVTTCYTIISPTGSGTPAFVRTTNSGESWQVQTRIDSNSLDGSLTCPTPTDCFVAYQNAMGRSTNGGKGWTINRIGTRPCPPVGTCPFLAPIDCPSRTTCYTGGSSFQNGKLIGTVITTGDGFRTRKSQPIGGLDGMTALSCPTARACFTLGGIYHPVHFEGVSNGGDRGRMAVTTDGGAHWRVAPITTPFPFNALACPTVSVCYAAGFLGRVMGTRNGGASWHDLIPVVFVSGTYGAKQPMHTYSSWFSASRPWPLTVGIVPGALGTDGRRLPASAACTSHSTVAVYVRNQQDRVVAGPIQVPRRQQVGGFVGRTIIPATGKLRLDMVAHCSSFSVRVDGVAQS